MAPTFRRCALLGAIVGAHLLLFSLISVNDSTRVATRPEETPATLFFVDLPTQDESRATYSFDPYLENKATREDSITLPPEIDETDARIEWGTEAGRVAGDVVRRIDEEKPFRSLDSHPAGMGPPPPGPSIHKRGDSQHFEGGEIITWTSSGCYYSNQNMPVAAFGQALRLQLPTCTGAGSGGNGGPPLPTIKEWKKERDSR